MKKSTLQASNKQTIKPKASPQKPKNIKQSPKKVQKNQKQKENKIQEQEEEVKDQKELIKYEEITLRYNHYIEKMETKNQKLTFKEIDDKFSFSGVYEGNFQIQLKKYPVKREQNPENYDQNIKTFSGLIDQQVYYINIIEDNVEEEKQRKKLKLYKEIHLTQLHDQIEIIRKMDKTPLIIDIDDKASIYFKYKGNVIDITEYRLKEQMQKITHEESLEEIRVQLMWGLKSGYTCVIIFDGTITDMTQFFEGARYFRPEELFIPSRAKEPEFYKEYVITEEEDVDWEGNKGNFQPHKDFGMGILFSKCDKEASLKSTLEEIQNSTGLNQDFLRTLYINPEAVTKQEILSKNPKLCKNPSQECPMYGIRQDLQQNNYDYISQAYELR